MKAILLPNGCCFHKNGRGAKNFSCPPHFLRAGAASGLSPPTLPILLEIRAYKNHYSVVTGYFRIAVETPLFHEI